MRVRLDRQLAAGTLACIVLLLASWPLASAEAGKESRKVDVSIISSVSQAASGSSVNLLLSQEIADGWHTYWRTPGDSGAPIELTFQLPEGVTVTPLAWPYPERIPFGPLMNFGYHDQVLLPFTLLIPTDFPVGSSLDLHAEGSVLVCADICIPEKVAVSFSLPIGTESINAGLDGFFSQALALIPQPVHLPASWRLAAGPGRGGSAAEDRQGSGNQASDQGKELSGLGKGSAAQDGEEGDGNGTIIASITLPFDSPDNANPASRIAGIEYFPFANEVIDNSAEQGYAFDDEGLHLTLQPGYEFTPDADLSGVLVVKGKLGGMLTAAYEINLPRQSSGLRDHASASSASRSAGNDPMGLAEQDSLQSLGKENPLQALLLALLLSFLGGLILNLMPCVFPVLSIKILSLIGSVGEGEGASIRLHGWVYAVGVVLSFMVIAGLLLGLRTTGEAAGWGFQLQSPLVVASLAYLFVLIGLNLLGLFEMGTSVMSLGQSSATGKGGHKLTSSLATGILATTVAAPCTAPFMGAAVGYAFTQPAHISLLVLGFLGAGMAAPYLLLCHAPGLVQRLPRPGPWMESMKQLLAFPMLASAIWLVWVLGIQVGPDGMMQVLAGALSLSLAIWLLAGRAASGKLALILRWGLAALALLGAGYALKLQYGAMDRHPITVSAAQQLGKEHVKGTDPAEGGSGPLTRSGRPGWAGQGAGVWQAYSPAALATALEQGPVFVNFTAAWCITCKVNELNALSSEQFHAALREKNVTYLKGDWTSEDPQITRALEEYGRNGVPLYLLYRQGERRASILPQLLTEGIVLDALNAL